MGAHFLMRFSGFALEISSSLTRLLHVCANCFMSRPAVADFPEGAPFNFALVLLTSAHGALCRAQQLVNYMEAVTIPSQVNSSSSRKRS